VISNQKMNGYLKDLCEICGFNEPITRICWKDGGRVEETAPKWALMGSHAGRRTFICNALTIGIPPQVVMKFTGHSDYKAMKPYIDIAETDAAKAMQLLND
jgi:integrase